MISDSERREVAAKMREIAHIKPGWTLDSLIVAAITSSTDAMRQPISETIADLIDRPTCRNLAVKPADEFLCSKCGEHVDIAYVNNCSDYHAKYCPNCGAVIADD